MTIIVIKETKKEIFEMHMYLVCVITSYLSHTNALELEVHCKCFCLNISFWARAAHSSLLLGLAEPGKVRGGERIEQFWIYLGN